MGRKALCQKHFETLRPLLFYPKNTLTAASDRAGCCHGHGLGLYYNKDSKIATLPEEMRNDIIVMEITFENGKTATKAITISLLDDGTFFASFGSTE